MAESRAARITDEQWAAALRGETVLMNRPQAERMLTAVPAGLPLIFVRQVDRPHLWGVTSLRRLTLEEVVALHEAAAATLNPRAYERDGNPDGTVLD